MELGNLFFFFSPAFDFGHHISPLPLLVAKIFWGSWRGLGEYGWRMLWMTYGFLFIFVFLRLDGILIS